MKKSLCLLIGLIILSCSEKKNDVLVEILSYKTLTNPKTIIRFDDKFPIYLDLKDSILFIINRNSSNCLIAVKLNTRQVIKELGTKGNGPNDVYEPEFIMNNSIINVADSFLYFGDVNTNRLLKVNATDVAKMDFEIISNYPFEIYPSDNLNFADNMIVGRRISFVKNEMFFIYNKNNMKSIDYYPKVKHLTKDLSYYYASNISANKSKNRIAIGMYFFDMIQIFDFSGNRLKSFCFSPNAIPQANYKSGILDLENGYAGFSQIYPLENYIYLRRNAIVYKLKDGESQEIEVSSILKLDWNGNLIDSYKLDKDFGWFCVNKEETELYVISNVLENDIEYYDILCYEI